MTTEFNQGDRVICFPGTDEECGAVVDGVPRMPIFSKYVRVMFDVDGDHGLVDPSELAHADAMMEARK